MEQRIATGDTLRRSGFDPRATTDAMLSNCFPSARCSPRQQCGNVHEIVGEYCRSDPQFEALVALGKAALHAATAEQDRDAPLDAGAKALALLEVPPTAKYSLHWAWVRKSRFHESAAPTGSQN
jgi:hypothetical protein